MGRNRRPGVFDTFRAGWGPARRRAGGRTAAPSLPATGAAAAPATASGPRRRGAARRNGAQGQRSASPELIRRKEELSRNFARLQWDLGGIAYEMARRDHYRLEILNAQAARLQEIDAELGQIERLLKLDEAGAAGTCPACGSLQARGAAYCWKCGRELKSETTETPTEASASPKAPQAAPAAKPAPQAKPIKGPEGS